MNSEYILEVREDNATGELGLMIQGTPMLANDPMVAVEGLLVAHDLIEHVNGHESIGSIDDELEALGGVWNTRGQWGVLRRDNRGSMYTPEQSIGSDVMNLGMIYMRGIDFRSPIPKTRETGDTEGWLDDVLENGKKDLISELQYDDEPIDFNRLNEYMRAAKHYIRQGYRKHVNKYGSDFEANNLFWNIADAVEPYIKHVEYQGQEFKLTINDRGVYCEENYDEYDEEY